MTPTNLRNAVLRDTTGKSGLLKVLGSTLVEGQLKVLDLASMSERYEPFERIREAIDNGAIRVERSGGITVAGHIDRCPEDEETLAQAREQIERVKEVMRRFNVSIHEALDRIANDPTLSSGEEKLRPRSTMYRWLRRDMDQLPPLVGRKSKGNRLARYSEDVRDLIVDTATDLYLQPHARWTLRKLTEHVNNLSHDRLLLPPSQNISRAYVKKVIFEDATTDEEKARMDPKLAIAAKAIAKQKIRVGLPFQRIEQDALHLPHALMTPWGISKDVWLVHAIDCNLSIPVGWHFVVGPPKDSDSLRCMDRVFSSKAAIFKSLGISSDVNLYGTPMRVIFDNGPENKGERMRSLARLNIAVTHCKARAAHGKPFIERLNRSLKEDIEVLPGSTRFDGKDGERDPLAEGDEIMTLEEFERWVIRWYFQDWVNKKLERFKRAVFVDDEKGQTPALRLKHMREREQFAFPLPPNRQEWRMIQYEKKKCTLSRKTGITYDTFQFAGPNLEHLIKLFGETEVTVLVDPDDFRQIFVPVGTDFTLVALINKDVDDGTPAHSYDRAKQILKDGEIPIEGIAERQAFRRDLFKRAADAKADVSKSVPKKSTRKMSKDTTERAREDNAKRRAAQNPLTTPSPLPQHSEQGTAWSVPGRIYPARSASDVPTS